MKKKTNILAHKNKKQQCIFPRKKKKQRNENKMKEKEKKKIIVVFDLGVVVIYCVKWRVVMYMVLVWYLWIV